MDGERCQARVIVVVALEPHEHATPAIQLRRLPGIATVKRVPGLARDRGEILHGHIDDRQGADFVVHDLTVDLVAGDGFGDGDTTVR